MLTFARNKLVSVAVKDRDTLSIQAVLDDDLYGLQIDLCVGLSNPEILTIAGKWNRRTTPECYKAIPFLQEMRGERLDAKIAERIHKSLGRKGCRHFANLLIECCHAATQAARVVRWEEAKKAVADLSFENFIKQEASGESPARAQILSETAARGSASSPGRVKTPRGEATGSGQAGLEGEEGFVIDLHTHSFPASSCSSASVDELIEEAKRIGLNGICLTDHNHVWSCEQVEDLRQKHDFTILRGNEITTNQGDMLVFGLDKDIRGIITIEELREEVARAGGFMIAAHPFRGFLTFSTVQLGLTVETAAQRPLFQQVNAVEALNGKVTEKENGFASSVARALGLPATGGSDAHLAAEVGAYATRFSVEIRTEAELIEALKSGEYAPVAFRSQKAAKAAGH